MKKDSVLDRFSIQYPRPNSFYGLFRLLAKKQLGTLPRDFRYMIVKNAMTGEICTDNSLIGSSSAKIEVYLPTRGHRLEIFDDMKKDAAVATQAASMHDQLAAEAAEQSSNNEIQLRSAEERSSFKSRVLESFLEHKVEPKQGEDLFSYLYRWGSRLPQIHESDLESEGTSKGGKRRKKKKGPSEHDKKLEAAKWGDEAKDCPNLDEIEQFTKDIMRRKELGNFICITVDGRSRSITCSCENYCRYRD